MKNIYRSTIFDNTYNALKGLVNNSCTMQLLHPDAKRRMGDIRYAEDMCTVELAGTRGQGHSTAVQKLALEYFDSAIFISHSMEFSRRVEADMRRFSEPMPSDFFFGTRNRIENLRGLDAEAIIVDMAKYITQRQRDEIYATFTSMMQRHNPFFFIFVG